jgi:outer membrane protein
MPVSKRSALFVGCIVVVILISGFLFFFKRDKLAYVESSRLLNEYKAMVDARKAFDVKSNQWQMNIDTLTKEVQQAIFKFEKEAGSEGEKKKAREEINIKQKQLRDYQQAVQQNAQQEEARISTQVLTEVNTFLMTYGKEHGYKMILVANNGNIAYADKDLDITSEIIVLLNKNYRKPIQ